VTFSTPTPVFVNRGLAEYNSDMKRQLICLRVGLTAILCVQFFGSDSGAQTRPNGCPAGIQRNVLDQELDGAASALISAIKSENPKNLMALLAANGVYLGVDGPLVPLTSIRKQMATRSGVYCVIFDSACLRKEVNESRKRSGATATDEEILSFHDHILKESDVAIKTTLAADTSSCGATTSDGSALFDLEWERTSKGWKIVAIPYI
jgi:hypothetical protein